jgi:hypothetical protein
MEKTFLMKVEALSRVAAKGLEPYQIERKGTMQRPMGCRATVSI